MDNEELKNKIAEILKKAMEPIEYGGDGEHAPEVHYPTEEEIADALIDAVIEDVREAEYRAEVAEKAGRIIQRDMARVFDVSNPRVCELIANIWDLAKKQAEKELQEEKKE